MRSDQFAHHLSESPVVMILRGVSPDTVLDVAHALVQGGVRFLEVTMNTDRAAESIALLSARYSENTEVMIGAGTVVSVSDVDEAHAAGATYMVSPNTNESVIRRTRDHELVSIPGFYSPTEAFAAIEYGADYLKCFPARSLGVSTLRDYAAVIPAPILAVGGVGPDNVADYLDVCVGVGVGGSVWSPGTPLDHARLKIEQLLESCRRS